jgi:hypothetical protein
MTDDRKSVYNKYEELPNLSYSCLKYLLDNNELIWKLLKYTDKDAYKNDSAHPNLTKQQKTQLINDGTPDPDNSKFRVFMDFGQDDAWTIQACILRITPIEIIPVNHIYGNVAMVFETYSHYQINQLSNYTTRINTITQQLLEMFNGQEIGGLGRLYFDAKTSSRCRMSVAGQIPFKGNAIVLCNWMA